MEAFQGHYRGGTGDGGHNFRWAAVLQFVNRIVVSLVLINMWSRQEAPTIQYLYVTVAYLFAMSLFYSLAHSYSKPYMNNIEGFLYGFLAIITLNVISFSLHGQSLKLNRISYWVHANALLVVMGMPSLILIVLASYRVLRRCVKGGARGVVRDDGSAEGLPDRLRDEKQSLLTAR